MKSNAIVLVKDGQAVGIGAGQQNRVESGEIAAKKAAGRAAGGACASRRVLPVPRRHRGGRRRRRRGDRATRRLDPRRAEHRARRRARRRDGVHWRTALPPLRPSPGELQMAAKMMPGGPVADAVFEDLVPRSEKLIENGHTPGLGTILVGDDGASARYVGMKMEKARGARVVGAAPSTCPRRDAGRRARRGARVQRRPARRRLPRSSTPRRRTSTSTPRCWRWIPTRTSTACTRSTWAAWR